MKKIMIFLFVLLVLVGCSTTNNDDKGYAVITPSEAKELMVEGNLIVDVREQSEYDAGHIENAILVPLSEIQQGNFEPLDDMSQTILIYCRSGSRAATASQILADAGYENIYDFGGINYWPDPLVQ